MFGINLLEVCFGLSITLNVFSLSNLVLKSYNNYNINIALFKFSSLQSLNMVLNYPIIL